LIVVVETTLFERSPRLRRFKSDRDEICHDCSSINTRRLTESAFLTKHHTFKLAAMTSFHAEKCCHVVSALAASVAAIDWLLHNAAPSAGCQLAILSTVPDPQFVMCVERLILHLYVINLIWNDKKQDFT